MEIVVLGVEKLVIPNDQAFLPQILLEEILDLVHPVRLIERLRSVIGVGRRQVLEKSLAGQGRTPFSLVVKEVPPF